MILVAALTNDSALPPWRQVAPLVPQPGIQSLSLGSILACVHVLLAGHWVEILPGLTALFSSVVDYYPPGLSVGKVHL